MSRIYDVQLNEKKVGTVAVEKRGLYYRFSCRCDLPDNNVYKLIVTCDGKSENLGVCVPQSSRFGVETSIPIKRVGEGAMQFCMVSSIEKSTGRFFPVEEESPFPALEELENACLKIQDGIFGIMIEDHKSKEISSPTGQ